MRAQTVQSAEPYSVTVSVTLADSGVNSSDVSKRRPGRCSSRVGGIWLRWGLKRASGQLRQVLRVESTAPIPAGKEGRMNLDAILYPRHQLGIGYRGDMTRIALEDVYMEGFEDFMENMQSELEMFIDHLERHGFSVPWPEGDWEAVSPALSRLAPNPDAEDEDAVLIQFSAGRYVGEVARQRAGGAWQLVGPIRGESSEPMPMITGHQCRNGLPFNPFAVVDEFLREGCRTPLASIAQRHLDM